MKKLFQTALLSTCFCLLVAYSYASNNQGAAIEAAVEFAALIDEGNYQAAYWSGSELLQLANDEQKWIDENVRAHKLLGTVQERNIKKTRPVNHFAGFPDDNYMIVFFNSKSTYKKNASELILVHQENDIWQVCAYSIR